MHKGQKASEETRRKMSLARQGMKFTLQHRQNLSKAVTGVYADSKHPNWKGDKAKYGALHGWIARKLGKPLLCDNCGNGNLTNRQYNWANISGNYKRDVSDWVRLCVRCHHLIDDIQRKV